MKKTIYLAFIFMLCGGIVGGLIAEGTAGSAAAREISAVVLDLAGYGTIAVALLQSALTVFHSCAEMTGSAPVNGSYEDFIQIKLDYDITVLCRAKRRKRRQNTQQTKPGAKKQIN